MKKYFVANWKMGLSFLETRSLTLELLTQLDPKTAQHHTIVLCPTALALGSVSNQILDTNLTLGSQDCSAHESGAYTGEVSAKSLQELSCSHVILGHSERRSYHHETNDLVAQKVLMVQRHAITPIVCVGESMRERENGTALKALELQLKNSLPTNCNQNQLIIAYEPIWAIGTGKIPQTQEIEEVHIHLKHVLKEHFQDNAIDIPLLYGGSVKPDNAQEILLQPHVDGVLIGGASMKTDSFLQIINCLQ